MGSTALQVEDREQRLSRARAALGAAERSAARWGGRIDRTALQPSVQSLPDSADDGLGTRLPVPGPLATLFPRGSLRAGSSVAIEGAATTSLLLSLAVAAVGEDSWCAIAGMPDLGLRSALDAGLDPCRLALAPADGDQRPQVLSALADGVGVLVLGPDLGPRPRTLAQPAEPGPHRRHPGPRRRPARADRTSPCARSPRAGQGSGPARGGCAGAASRSSQRGGGSPVIALPRCCCRRSAA